MIDYAKLLNPEQCEAATAGDGPLLVLAAAGTGKTRTLVHRVAYLTEDRGIPADNLVLLTFTNRAAREMMDRAKEIVGGGVGSIWSGTFHHVCNRFLRRFAESVGYRRDFLILDREDSLSIIQQGIKSVTSDTKNFPKKEVIASIIGTAANRSCEVGDLVGEKLMSMKIDPVDIERVARFYVEKKNELGAMDFDDLLVKGLELLKTDESVRTFYQEKFRHVLVDEYQDTNMLQAQIVDILAGYHKNVMAVGDDFQCIYSWRGADIQNIMEFPKRWPGCRIVKLERNYRSTPEILNVANTCIRGNPQQFQKTLTATRPGRVKPYYYILRDGQEQAMTLMKLIQTYVDRGYRLGDMAVLYRAHFHSIELQMVLGHQRIPYRITSGVGVFEQRHVKDVIAFLRVLVYPHDELSFIRLLTLLPGIGEKSALADWIKLGGRFEAASPESRAALSKLIKRPAAQERWRAIDKLIAGYHAPGEVEMSGGEVVERFLDLFYRDYLQKTLENPENREDDLHELGAMISRSESISAFLEEVSLLTNVDHEYEQMAKGGEEEDKLHLSTVHQAKGLEWPLVFIIWANEGMFPSTRSIVDSGDDTEERRLFYVAVTRARDELFICSPGRRFTQNGDVMRCLPSRFVKELPKGLLTERYGCRIY